MITVDTIRKADGSFPFVFFFFFCFCFVSSFRDLSDHEFIFLTSLFAVYFLSLLGSSFHVRLRATVAKVLAERPHVQSLTFAIVILAIALQLADLVVRAILTRRHNLTPLQQPLTAFSQFLPTQVCYQQFHVRV
jgi:hypothetical protein